MSPERIRIFLRFFYQAYVEKCYQQTLIVPDSDSDPFAEHYDIPAYLIRHLDIYIENCDYLKEYATVYNTGLFSAPKETKAENFNELQIFLIENIQLFFHTILEAAVRKVRNSEKPEKLTISFLQIDNKGIKLLDLINISESRMKELSINPPASG